jgi:hypothetical protein
MRHVSIQFAPLERAPAVRARHRRSVQFLGRETTQVMPDDSFAAPARNMRITWKVILLLWLLFLAALCLHARVPVPETPKPQSVGTVTGEGAPTISPRVQP